MNLLSTHDQARSCTSSVTTSEGRRAGADPSAKRRLRLAVFFQMTFPGAPTVFYGDEVGVTGGDDPFNRATYPWADRGGKPDLELLAEFKRLIAMRKANPVLSRGSLSAPLHLDEHVIVLARQYEGTWAITATNNASTPATVTISLPAGLDVAKFEDVLSHATVRSDTRRLTFTVPAESGTVLIGR